MKTDMHSSSRNVFEPEGGVDDGVRRVTTQRYRYGCLAAKLWSSVDELEARLCMRTRQRLLLDWLCRRALRSAERSQKLPHWEHRHSVKNLYVHTYILTVTHTAQSANCNTELIVCRFAHELSPLLWLLLHRPVTAAVVYRFREARESQTICTESLWDVSLIMTATKDGCCK